MSSNNRVTAQIEGKKSEIGSHWRSGGGTRSKRKEAVERMAEEFQRHNRLLHARVLRTWGHIHGWKAQSNDLQNRFRSNI